MKLLNERGNPYNNNMFWDDRLNQWSIITKRTVRMNKIKNIWNS